MPYYNKPPQRGLAAHFAEVATHGGLPVIMYNVPGRTITSMNLETAVALSKVKNIIGIKEASGDVSFDEKLKQSVATDFAMLSGDDPTYIPFLKIGGNGLISVMSNMMTPHCTRWTKLCADGKWSEAETDFSKYKQIISLMYCEANPIPLKWMMYKMGLMQSPEMRLPLVTLESTYHEVIFSEMKKLELI